MSVINVQFPAQKKAMGKKTKKWRRECVDAAEGLALWRYEGLRKSYRNKRINFDLYSDILDQSDVERICNPLGVLGMNAPAKMQNYPICNPKIDLLVGEAIKRKFDWQAVALNNDAISEKEEDLLKRFEAMAAAHLSDPNASPEQIEEDLKNFTKFKNFEYQDHRERMATQVLTYLHSHLRLDNLFAKGFKNALISSEEIYQVDIIAGEPTLRVVNPMNIHTVRSGESNYVEDADIIVISTYMSPGQVIDDYHDELTPSEIDDIESGLAKNTTAESGLSIGYKPDLAIRMDEAIDLAVLENDLGYGSPFDNNGNIRVTRVYWKSLRKMKKVKYYDEAGDEQWDLFDEHYKIDKSAGEEEEIIWINEWWEGHKLGGSIGSVVDDRAIYTRMRPKPIQFRSMENPSKCHPGIVGTIYNTNDNEGVSLMDRMKPYQYLYNILAYNTELAVAKNHGKIMRLDISQVPENWEIDKWLSYAQGMNLAVFDGFKEGNKGVATGKMAGMLQPQAPVIDMEMGNTIQLYMNMMAFIKQEMGEIAGVTGARQGQISNREAVGNVEREVTQTSHITEYWFMEHDYTKIRVLECLLETAKVAWKDKKNKKVQHVLDDGSTMLFTVDGEVFNESEYGIKISDSRNSHELIQTMKQLAHAGIQNGLINFSQLLDIYSTESIASIRRKIQRSESDKMKQEEQVEKRKQEMQQEMLNAQALEEENKRNFTREEWDREDARTNADNDTKIIIERMRQDNMESKYSKLHDSDGIQSLEALRLQAEKIDKDYKIKTAELEEKKRHNKATEKKAATKAK